MFKVNSLLRFFKPSCSNGSCDTAKAGTVQELLSKEKIGILSASCCDSSTQGKDELLASNLAQACLLYTSPSPRDGLLSRMPSSA